MKNVIIAILSCIVVALIIIIIILCHPGEKIKTNNEPTWDNVKRVQ